MRTINKLNALLVGSLMLLAAFSPALAISGLTMTPRIDIASINTNQVFSSNWSGYAVPVEAGTVNSASGSWTVPAVSGSSGAYSAFWVGIDGYNTSTVEQTGTIGYISGRTSLYYAWYEFYPSAMVEITSRTAGVVGTPTVKPGDVISASVTYLSGSTFSVSISDKAESWSFSTTVADASATRSSAEFIAEAPSSYRGVLPLANFGTVNFGQQFTSVTATCTANIGSLTNSIGLFPSVQNITMAYETISRTRSGTVVSFVPKAVPTYLSADGTSFTVTWKNAG